MMQCRCFAASRSQVAFSLRRAWHPTHCSSSHEHLERRYLWQRARRNVQSTFQRRYLGLNSIPSVLLPPTVFIGLLVSLWTYKCMMMVIFQNRIIYMPSMPPFSRSEKVSDYAHQCRPVEWTERSLKSLDDTKLVMLEGQVPAISGSSELVVVYFQGNGSSTPPRLPDLSRILSQTQKACSEVKVRFLALSYRGYWKSSGRPSQKGIEMDAQATLDLVAKEYDLPNTRIVLWGQSIGAGVATTALASWTQKNGANKLPIAGLVLETPFTSLHSMLIALYPQRFLPYRYLGLFLMSTWDSMAALNAIGHLTTNHELHRKVKCLLLEAGDDELVPKGEARRLLDACNSNEHIEARHEVVSGAFHTNVMMKSTGQKRIVNFLQEIADDWSAGHVR